MYKLKVPIRDKCPTCEGKTCLPIERDCVYFAFAALRGDSTLNEFKGGF